MTATGSTTGFIFSYNRDDEDIQALAAVVPSADFATPSTSQLPSRRAGLGSRQPYQDDEFVAYGPTTHRRGTMRFVPAKASGGYLGMDEEDQVTIKREDRKGKGRAIDQDAVKMEDREDAEIERRVTKEAVSGNVVRGLYSSIVGLRTAPTTAVSSPVVSSPRRIPKRSNSTPPLPSLEADIVLSSDSEVEIKDEGSDSDLEIEEDDDDIIVVDPLTNLPESLPNTTKPNRRLKPRLIHELLGSSALDAPLVPPTYYALHESSLGYRLLAKQGWKEGDTLGPEGGRGLKVPLRAIEKFDRKGLGSSSTNGKRKLTSNEKEEERRRIRREERDKRGKGTRGMARAKKKEEVERKAWISYMNR